MDLTLNIAMFLFGLVGIIKGADWLTDGAATIARRLNVPTIVVGMTIVAVGSSMPEFVVSVVSAVKGSTDMAVGNVVGSNIFNILVIMGVTALVAPIDVTWSNIRNDIPFAVLSSVVVLICILDGNVSRYEGMLMLCIFLIFLSYTLSMAKAGITEPAGPDASSSEPAGWGRSILLVVVGLTLLLLGGNWLVDGGSGAARMLGLSESLISLTFISMGTSAPELAASVIAARKGDHGMAVGNVVGSVVFNVFFVLGTAAVVRPLMLSGLTMVDFGTLILGSLLLWAFARLGGQRLTITRTEGTILTLFALAYYVWLSL